MFKNFLRLSIRNIKRHKLNSFINIIGLALGLAASLLILFYLKSELSYDRFFLKADRIYRITVENLDENGLHWAAASPVHTLEIQSDIPEIEEAARLFYIYRKIYNHETENSTIIRHQEEFGYCADQAFLQMFDIELIHGNAATALTELNSIVLTESMAKKYFGEENPLGKTLFNESDGVEYTVTGVMQDLPNNTHLKFDHLISISTLYKMMEERGAGDWMESRGWAHFYSFVLLNEQADMAEVEQKLLTFTENFYEGWYEPGEIHQHQKLHLQPLTDIHLKSDLEQEMGANSNIIYVYVFAFIIVLILLLAGVNFVNLSTARAFNRMQEVGLRKVIGADKRNLIWQFLTESLLLAFIAVIVALLLIELALPIYNSITALNLTFSQIMRFENLLLVCMLFLITGILSGLYPAIFMSRFNVVSALKGIRNPGSGATSMRNILVVFQFVISIFMIFSTIIIYEQMQYFQQKNLGFDKDQLIALNLSGDMGREVVKHISTLKAEFLNYPGIKAVTMSSNLPGERFSVEDIQQETIPEDIELPPIRYLRVDHDFIETLGLEIVEGKSFADWTSNNAAFILNEKALKAIQLKDPIGKIASNFRGTQAEIVGIVKDFNFASLHDRIEPLVLELKPQWSAYLLMKIEGGKIENILELLQGKMEEISPGSIFNYTFLDERLNRLYANEKRLSDIFRTFSVLALIISCLGLFGLSAYYAELRTKEIGIRKALGAGVGNLVTLLSAKFMIWVGLANLIALPCAWLVMQRWLRNFAYKIEISPVVLLVSLAASVSVALLTVSFRTFKAAVANPVDALKYE